MNYWKQCRRFLSEFRRDFRHTGAVLPSSPFLARAMTSHLRRPRRPARILEVGPGTGPVTSELVRSLQPADRLTLVEINDRFVEVLRHRLETEDGFRRHQHQIELVHSPVQEIAGESTYDYIISGLPLNNFPTPLVRDLFRVFERLLAPGGRLTFFEYILIRHLKSPFVGRREKIRLRRVGRIMKRYIARYETNRSAVWPNVPPAWVHHLELKPLRRPAQRTTAS